LHISASDVTGLFAGALTSTPTLQAAMEAAKTSEPAGGHSVAYPFRSAWIGLFGLANNELTARRRAGIFAPPE
jgi:uncharacterized transporter YbjL